MGARRLACAGEYFPIPVANRLVSSSDIENIRHANILAFEQLALRRFHFPMRGHAIGRDNDLLSFFGKQIVDEQRASERMGRVDV